MPEYPGGEEAIRKDIAELIKYPAEARKKGVSGKVYITFIVNELGGIERPQIARGVDPLLDKEALRVMNLLKTWKPGKQRGETVKVSFTVPINFALDGGSKNETTVATDDEEPVFLIVEEMPVFPGGKEALGTYISKSVKYPEEARKERIQGKVFVSFVVAKDGNVKQSKIERSIHPTLDKEALRVINSLPTWKPGKQRGKLVNVRFTVPINFALSNGDNPNKELKQ